MTFVRILAAVLSLSAIVPGQVAARRPSVSATGSATVTSPPDLASISFVVQTNANSAQDAASQNAALSSAVIGALQGVLGTSGRVQGASYSLAAVESSSGRGTGGFAATNTVQADVYVLSLVAKAIDAGVRAGAIGVQSVSYSLKDSESATLQALRQAAALARSHADAIASGSGQRLGSIISVGQGTSSTTSSVVTSTTLGAFLYLTGGFTSSVQTADVTTTASVTIEFELM